MYNIMDVVSSNEDLVNSIDIKSNEFTHINGHSLRVSRMAVDLAIKIKLPPEDINQVLIGSYIHDIGKVFLSKEILNGDKPLSPKQREELITHTVFGHRYLEDVKGLEKAKEIVLLHHERIDGTGYPYGILGYEIPTHVKIVSICDTYDAMTSYRAYRKGIFTHEEAIQELIDNKGTQFDSTLVDVFVRQFKSDYRNI